MALGEKFRAAALFVAFGAGVVAVPSGSNAQTFITNEGGLAYAFTRAYTEALFKMGERFIADYIQNQDQLLACARLVGDANLKRLGPILVSHDEPATPTENVFNRLREAHNCGM